MALHFTRSMGVVAVGVLDEEGCDTGVDSFDLTFSFTEAGAGGGARETLGDGLAEVVVEDEATGSFGGREAWLFTVGSDGGFIFFSAFSLPLVRSFGCSFGCSAAASLKSQSSESSTRLTVRSLSFGLLFFVGEGVCPFSASIISSSASRMSSSSRILELGVALTDGAGAGRGGVGFGVLWGCTTILRGFGGFDSLGGFGGFALFAMVWTRLSTAGGAGGVARATGSFGVDRPDVNLSLRDGCGPGRVGGGGRDGGRAGSISAASSSAASTVALSWS